MTAATSPASPASPAPLEAEWNPRTNAYGPVESCPVCDTREIRPLAGDDRWSFRCDDCGAGWKYVLGHLIAS